MADQDETQIQPIAEARASNAAAGVVDEGPKIKKLSQQLIDKIAAGEVVQRPSSAVKELIENSLDAGSTEISVTLMQGGLKQLVIEDNGSGIHKDDFPLLCERFATSKIKDFSDLSSLASFGFRGEALASISFVSQLRISTRQPNQELGYFASFKNGIMIDQEPEQLSRLVGTTIDVADLFYNYEVRKKSLNVNDEKRRIVKLIGQFATHHTNISFKLRSDNQILFSSHNILGATSENSIHEEEGGYFAYLSIEMNPQNLDPNVHPTKKEVKFLFELEIAREVEKWAFILLKDTGVVKRLNSTVEPINMKDNRTSINPNQERYVDQNILNINNSNLRKSSQQSSTPQANKQIRVDPKDQKLTKFWKAQHDKEKGLGDNNSTPIKNELFNAYIGSSEKKTKFDLRDSSDQKLLANDQNNIILELKDIDLIRDRLFDELKTLTDAKTTQFFRQLCFLSSISSNHMLAQHSQDLYLINTIPIMEELFKYEIIRTFGRSKNLELQNPIDLKELLNHFLLNSDKIPFARRKHHLSNLEVYLDDLNNLKDYLHKSIGLVISNNQIIALPNPYNLFTATDTLSQHDLAYTMLRIASQVNFSSVLASSSGLATEFANYLAWRLEMPFKQRQKQEKDIEKWNHFFEHTLLPTIKTKMALKKLDVQQFTAKVFSQEEAYKIFERC